MPFKKSPETRSISVHVRFSRSEMRSIHACHRARGINLTQWVRSKLLDFKCKPYTEKQTTRKPSILLGL